ncbi:MAG TPA: hypothetical protein VKA60_03655 [Blastocatellia bacterium]|nr:hypothetical protein [Blastocatellia bacterium]
MSRKLMLPLLIVCAVLLGAGATLAQSTAPAQVLPLIEKYKAPPYRASGFLDRETYDYRVQYHNPVPATLTDVLICDVWQRVTMDLKLKVTPKEVSEETIKQALNVYLTKRWDDIAGYRPWTHWNFVRGLKPPQRDQLAKEIVEYIGKHGVRDVEN